MENEVISSEEDNYDKRPNQRYGNQRTSNTLSQNVPMVAFPRRPFFS